MLPHVQELLRCWDEWSSSITEQPPEYRALAWAEVVKAINSLRERATPSDGTGAEAERKRSKETMTEPTEVTVTGCTGGMCDTESLLYELLRMTVERDEWRDRAKTTEELLSELLEASSRAYQSFAGESAEEFIRIRECFDAAAIAAREHLTRLARKSI